MDFPFFMLSLPYELTLFIIIGLFFLLKFVSLSYGMKSGRSRRVESATGRNYFKNFITRIVGKLGVTFPIFRIRPLKAIHLAQNAVSR